MTFIFLFLLAILFTSEKETNVSIIEEIISIQTITMSTHKQVSHQINMKVKE